MRLLIALLLTVPAFGQPLTRANVANILGFEDSVNGRLSPFWNSGSNPEITADSEVVHSGNYSARISRTAPDNFTTISAAIPYTFRAQTIQLRAFLKLEDVSGNVAIWLRQDGPGGGNLAFATLQTQNVRGTADWREYSIQIPAQPSGSQIVFGFFVNGSGRGWVDSMQLLADGKPVAEAPEAPLSILVTDRQFDNGSGTNVTALNDTQVTNLARLGMVWGFLKYHHPTVTRGLRHWDYELFRVLPSVLAASDAEAANQAIHAWVLRLGTPPPCDPCVGPRPTGVSLSPDLDWVRDSSFLGPELSETLQTIHVRRPIPPQFYVNARTGVGNPSFDNELSYANLRHPDSGYQLLALFRFWNMMQYFNPNRDIMGDDPSRAATYWPGVLVDSIRRFALAPDRLAYQRALLRLIAAVNDTHANLYTGNAALPPMGACALPIDGRFLDGQFVVYRLTARDPANNLLQLGDVLTHLGGAPLADLVAEWSPYYPASNEPTRLREIARTATRGDCGPVPVTVQRGSDIRQLTLNRLPVAAIDFSRSSVHDLPGPAFQKLADDIAYLKLSGARIADAASYVRQAEGTRGLILDIRNYPLEFVVFALGQLLVPERTPIANFTFADFANPGSFYCCGTPFLQPQTPRYTGKIVILIDEVSQSQAEYTTMAFRNAPGAIVIGSTTAGADGDVSSINLPGGQTTGISGIGVFYPDGRPTQRIGILPDIEVLPTIAGIRAGRDELIEAAIRVIRQP
ncbi:MAG: hypothetical protein JNK87_40590 [Bryobacterales bacterium]|nr:hypothetical protein [Bryobacterales bacterium]